MQKLFPILFISMLFYTSNGYSQSKPADIELSKLSEKSLVERLKFVAQKLKDYERFDWSYLESTLLKDLDTVAILTEQDYFSFAQFYFATYNYIVIHYLDKKGVEFFYQLEPIIIKQTEETKWRIPNENTFFDGIMYLYLLQERYDNVLEAVELHYEQHNRNPRKNPNAYIFASVIESLYRNNEKARQWYNVAYNSYINPQDVAFLKEVDELLKHNENINRSQKRSYDYGANIGSAFRMVFNVARIVTMAKIASDATGSFLNDLSK